MDGINATRVTLNGPGVVRCRELSRWIGGVARAYHAEFDERAKVKRYSDRPKHDWSSHSPPMPHGICLWRGVRSRHGEAEAESRATDWDAAFNRDEVKNCAYLEGGVNA